MIQIINRDKVFLIQLIIEKKMNKDQFSNNLKGDNSLN